MFHSAETDMYDWGRSVRAVAVFLHLGDDLEARRSHFLDFSIPGRSRKQLCKTNQPRSFNMEHCGFRWAFRSVHLWDLIFCSKKGRTFDLEGQNNVFALFPGFAGRLREIQSEKTASADVVFLCGRSLYCFRMFFSGELVTTC